jgi:hypothetical protein
MASEETKKDTIKQALEECIHRRKQLKILQLFGTIEFDPKYDYKKQRSSPVCDHRHG